MDAAFDCIVLGAGPAGSTAAALIAAAGARTLLVETDRAARFAVGESLMPVSFPLLQRLGVAGKLQSGKFVPKYGTELIGAAGKPAEKFCHADSDPASLDRGGAEPGSPSRTQTAQAGLPKAWQVVRSEFDELLRQNALARGALTRDGARATDVLFCGQRASGVRIDSADGRTQDVTGRVIIDATGPRALLAERLGLRETNPAPHRMAVWGQYENAHRAAGADGGSTLFLQTQDRRAWFWFIPLAENRVSIGVVGNRQSLPGGHGKAESVFEEQLVNCPAVVERLAEARLVGSFHVWRDFSWSSRQAAGEGWLLVGDALAGWDPLFSAGLSFALRSAELAGNAVIDALSCGEVSTDRLGHWAGTFAAQEHSMRRLIAAFATDGFCPFEFLAAHPQHRAMLGDLLAGKVCDSAGPLLADLDRWQNPAQPLAQRPEVMR
jgi:flavin-dependent dehydrogenase